jgi:hypothetical protein
MGLNESQKKERSEYLEENLKITECSQKKPYVFISYASDNWETVFKSAVVPLQKQYGLRVYADKAFDKVNDKWIVPMLRNVRGADMMIAFVSQSYIESYACFLELLTAVNNKKPIVFVSLEERLHLGDTTDQPVVERGVKNEILNQGGNIATNTNNTSNDIMRAMKSAYTSLSTLLEQDALSKYDISDAFINFFRDASINRKTIHDLGAVRGTIDSVSRSVFDPSLLLEPAYAAAPAYAQAESPSVPAEQQEPQPAPAYAQAESPSAPAEQQELQPAPAHAQAESPSAPAEQQEESTYVSRPPQQKAEGFLSRLKSFKSQSGGFKAGVLAGGAGLLAVLVLLVVLTVGGSPRQVTDMPYVTGSGTEGSYTGEMKGKKASGQGTLVYKSGDVYEGEWEDGYSNGQGTCTFANGNIYVGSWKNDLFDGEGVYTWSDGVVFTGQWANGEYSGPGTLVYPNGDVFKGEFTGSTLSGKGSCTYANGDIYEGEWKGDGPEGQGTCTYANGDIFEGEWKDGSVAYGTLTTAGGDAYTGEWKENKMTGKGSCVYANGDVYEGEWAEGIPNGQGTISYANGASYEGEWKDNTFNGHGIYTWNADDGRVFEGEWVNGQANGPGIMTYSNGTVTTGTWKDGQLLQ